jgi:hypothetical protein
MAFRDDMEALTARNESLEAEIEELRGAAREHDELKRLVEKQNEELTQLKEKLKPLEEDRANTLRKLILGGVLVVLIAVGFVAMYTSSISSEAEYARAQWSAETERAEVADQRVQAVQEQRDALRGELRSVRAENVFLDRELREAQQEQPFDLVLLPGRVRRATGQAPVATGASCTIEVRPNTGEHNCRSIVTCGETLVYGTDGQGYNTCGLRDERPSFARDSNITDNDGDPMFELDLARQRIVISDGATAEELEYTIEIAVDDR